MRETAGELRKQSHLRQRLLHLFHPFLIAYLFIDIQQPFTDNIIHLGTLVQGCHGILEDHLYLLNNLLIQLAADPAVDLISLIDDFPCRNRMNPHDSPPDSSLAGSGLSHDTKGFSPIYLKAYPSDCFKRFTAVSKGNMQIFHIQQNLSLCTHPSTSRFFRLRIPSGGSSLGALGSNSQVFAL